MPNGGKYTTVSIPVELAGKVRSQIKDTGFKNLSDYVTFLLREIASTKGDWNRAKSDEDRERVKAKLRSLGYL
jgi:Arc/MetJ-type ribon-helix-helix transcriptional regulator